MAPLRLEALQATDTEVPNQGEADMVFDVVARMMIRTFHARRFQGQGLPRQDEVELGLTHIRDRRREPRQGEEEDRRDVLRRDGGEEAQAIVLTAATAEVEAGRGVLPGRGEGMEDGDDLKVRQALCMADLLTSRPSSGPCVEKNRLAF